MAYARKTLVCLNDTPYYHVIARCVRRSWLYGFDAYAGKDYSHRKTRVLERLHQLAHVFAIDVCAYAVLSNHYHLVLHVDPQRAAKWAREQVVGRWAALFTVPAIVERWRSGVAGGAERESAELLIELWRERLMDISWYMRCLNEHLARRANAEDDCTGRFWEGRFRSQALLDEAGLLTAMAYVDLNPVRAGIAPTPEASEFTSIYQRVQAYRSSQSAACKPAPIATAPLLRFSDAATPEDVAIPFGFVDYLELLDWTGRVVRPDKTGAMNPRTPPILVRMNLDVEAWQSTMRPAGNRFGRALGRLERLRRHADALGQSWVKGLGIAERLFRAV